MIIADLTGNAGLQSDRINSLAVPSKTRSKKYPDLPTLDESGVKGYEVHTWMAFFGLANMPGRHSYHRDCDPPSGQPVLRDENNQFSLRRSAIDDQRNRSSAVGALMLGAA
jgi:hypothetical protein